jgi:hypothetical protein
LGPNTEFDKRQLNQMAFSLSVCTEVNLVVVSFIASLVVYVHPANARMMMQRLLLIHRYQWLCRHCSGSNAVKKPELTTTSGCSGSETCLLGNV